VCTGHSCRTQVQRCAGFTPLHPAQALLRHLDETRDETPAETS